MNIDDLKIGQVWRGKKPKLVGVFEPYVDDREILHISGSRQPVKRGGKYVYTKQFTEWKEEKTKDINSKYLSQEYLEMMFEKENPEVGYIEYDYVIQYNSPSVKIGSKYPTMYFEKFKAWAGKEISSALGKQGEWATKLETI